jgi:hypothetical protein
VARRRTGAAILAPELTATNPHNPLRRAPPDKRPGSNLRRVHPSCPTTTIGIESTMDRPCFLVVDREYPGSISTRKLVIESAKFNVITAYDADEAITCLKRFRNVDGVVLNASLGDDQECRSLIDNLRKIVPGIEIVVTSAGGYRRCDHNEHYIDSFDPKLLLDCLQSLKREATSKILEHDAQITR